MLIARERGLIDKLPGAIGSPKKPKKARHWHSKIQRRCLKLIHKFKI
jgi:hypothetical protein